jgi:Strictosidine synthase
MKSDSIRGFIDRLLGRGDAAVTVPPLDGALKPNNRLEEAAEGIVATAPDNIVEWDGQLLFSSGSNVRSTDGRTSFDAHSAVTAMASSPGGLLAVATDSDGISIKGFSIDGIEGASRRITGLDAAQFSCTTAMAFADDKTLFACVGSSEHPFRNWAHDLLDGGRTGSLWRIDLDSAKATLLTSGLAFPNGIAFSANGDCIVSESWQKRLVRISANGAVVGQVVEDLPGYPGRLSPSGRGGYWLCVFAPRSQLIEFVLREPAYRRAMMNEVEPELWIAPALSSGKSVLEPMQGGALKQMGMLKPWAPTQSYGLIVELNGAFVPILSLHSRAGGKRHGITSSVERAGSLWVTSKGGDELIALELEHTVEPLAGNLVP